MAAGARAINSSRSKTQRRESRFDYDSVPAGKVGLDFRSYHTLTNDKLSLNAQIWGGVVGGVVLFTGLIMLAFSDPYVYKTLQTAGIITTSIGACICLYILIGICLVCPNEWRRNKRKLPDNVKENDVYWL